MKVQVCVCFFSGYEALFGHLEQKYVMQQKEGGGWWDRLPFQHVDVDVVGET